MKCVKIEPKKLEEVLQKIETFFCKLDDNLRFKMMLICEEVITNQIRHANFEKKEPDILFCFNTNKNNNSILIFKDNAKKFNPLKKEDPDVTKSLEDTKLGGLGIFMIKKYSKKLYYEYSNNYNILKIEL